MASGHHLPHHLMHNQSGENVHSEERVSGGFMEVGKRGIKHERVSNHTMSLQILCKRQVERGDTKVTHIP